MLAAHLECHLRGWQGPDPLKPLGLATGRTMEPLYRTLVERLLSWSAAVSYTHLRAHETPEHLVVGLVG